MELHGMKGPSTAQGYNIPAQRSLRASTSLGLRVNVPQEDIINAQEKAKQCVSSCFSCWLTSEPTGAEQTFAFLFYHICMEVGKCGNWRK